MRTKNDIKWMVYSKILTFWQRIRLLSITEEWHEDELVKDYYSITEALFEWLEVFIISLKLKLQPVKLKRYNNK